MKIRNPDGITYTDVNVVTYTPNILINYEFVELSNQHKSSIDRGMETDRYLTQFVFSGDKQYINDLYILFENLRSKQLPVILSEMEDHYFAENVDHSIPISTVVFEITPHKSPTFRSFEFSVSLLADTETLAFIGTSAIPSGIKCLQHGYDAYNVWNTLVNESYNRNTWFVDYEADSYSFIGEYYLLKNEMRDILAWHKAVRGNEISIIESDFGVSGMFGPSISATNHTIVIEKLEYESTSSNLKRATITLNKVG